MQVATGKEGAVTLVRPLGPMVAEELEGLERELDRLVRQWARRVVIDMSEVPFLDSAGLELLCRYGRELAEHGLELKLSGLSEMSQKIMDLTRVARRFQIFPDTATAVRSFLL